MVKEPGCTQCQGGMPVFYPVSGQEMEIPQINMPPPIGMPIMENPFAQNPLMYMEYMYMYYKFMCKYLEYMEKCKEYNKRTCD